MEESDIIDFTPSYKTITATGQSHFSRVSDALAEFVDNSLQAMHSSRAECATMSKRLIDIKVFFDENSITIADNGEGMDKEKIREFATFALEQDMRESTGRDFISKFGVGAKQAGFYIGDKISIITRKHNGKILEFVIDEARLDRRSRENNASVFRDSIVARDEPLEITDETPKMQQYISNFEKMNRHFTVIVLHMRPHIAISLKRSTDISVSLSQELASIYHFHLHPEDLPNHVMRSERFHNSHKSVATGKNANNIDAPKAIKSSFMHVAEVVQDSKLEITVEVIKRGSSVVVPLSQASMNLALGISLNNRMERALSKVGSMPNRLIHAEGAYPFRFNLTIPDPRPQKMPADSNKELAKLTTDTDNWGTTMTGAFANMSVVEGIIFYYPTKAGRSSKPNIHQKIYDIENDDASIDGDMDESEEQRQRSMIYVYWQDRLVPETKLTTLPFMPDCRTPVQCQNMEVPVNWRDRLQGFLFFGWDFRHISNNKLKFQVDPNLNEWINNKHRFRDEIQTQPNSLPKAFLRWLQFCHKHFDQDCVFMVRDDTLSIQFTTGTVFQRLKIGSDDKKIFDCKKEHKNQNMVKVKVEKKNNVCVTLLGFLVPTQLPSSQQEYHGTDVKILCRRAPASIFGAEPEILKLPLSALDVNKRIKVTKEDLQDIEKKSASSINMIMLYNGEWRAIDSEGIEIKSGDKIDWLGIQTRNSRRVPVFSLPDAPSLKYSVYLEILGSSGQTNWSGLCKTPMINDPDAGVILPDTDTAMADKYYFFQNLTNFRTGVYELNISVRDGDRVVQKFSNILKVLCGPPASFSVVLPDDATGRPIRLGDFLPDLEILFKDSAGNAVEYWGNVHLKITCPQLTVLCDQIESEWDFEMNGEPKLEFDTNIWSAVPKELPGQAAIISDTDVTDATIEFTATCSLCNGEERFRLRFEPGYPVEMKVLQPTNVVDNSRNFSIRISRDSQAEPFTLVFFDKFKNRTGPIGREKWTVSAEKGGPLEPFPPITCNPDGTVTVENLRSKITESGYKNQKFLLTKIIGKEKEILCEFEFGVNVEVSRKPHKLMIYQKNDDIGGTTIRCIAGSTLDHLKAVFVDENGTVISDVADSFLDSNGITVSWNEGSGANSSNRKKGKKGQDNLMELELLPPIQVDKIISEPYSIEYTVKATITHDVGLLESSFFVDIVPSEPKEWQILFYGSPHDGIMLGEEDDLISKIKGLCLRDEFGNMVAPEFSYPSPSLKIEWSGDDEVAGISPIFATLPCGETSVLEAKDGSSDWSVDIDLCAGSVGLWTADNQLIWDKGIFTQAVVRKQKLRSTAKLSHDGDGEEEEVTLPKSKKKIPCYVVKNAICFGGRVEGSYPLPLKLSLSDAHQRYATCTIDSNLVPGLPSQLRLKCPDLNICDHLVSLSATVTTNRELDSFEAKFLDKFGNDASIHRIKACKVNISFGKEELISKKSNKGNLLHKFGNLKISKLLEKLPNATIDTVQLECNGTFTLVGEEIERHISPASITLKLVKSNRVIGLNVRLTKIDSETGDRSSLEPLQTSMVADANSEEKKQYAIPIDEQFEIALDVLTEDGIPFYPDINFFGISTKFCQFETSFESIIEQYLPDNYVYRGREEVWSDLFSAHGSDANDHRNGIYYRHPPNLGVVNESDQFLKIGLYEVSISYSEMREGTQYQSKGRKKISSTVYILATSGKPVALEMDQGLSSLATHVSLGSEIGSNFKIRAVDIRGNKCFLTDEHAAIICRLMNFSDNEQTSEVAVTGLHLRGSDATAKGSVLLASRQPDGSFVFPSIVLDEMISEEEVDFNSDLNSVYLSFEFEGHFELIPYRKRIGYYSSAAQAHELQQLTDELHYLSKEIRNYDDILCELRHQLRSKNDEVMILVHKLWALPFSQEDSNPAALTQDFYSNYLQLREVEIQRMQENASQSRRAVKGLDYENNNALCTNLNLSFPSAGIVIDLGFVQDAVDSQILSWAAQSFLSAAVVYDDRDAMNLIENGCVRSIIIERRPNTKLFEKNLNALKAKLRGLPGNPCLMIDLVETSDENSFLRESLFFVIFREALLIQSKNEIIPLRRWFSDTGAPPPPIFSADGYCIGEDGLLCKKPEHLEYIFGEQNVLETSRYREALKDINLLKENQDLFPALENLNREINEKISEESDIQIKRDKVNQLQMRIDSITASSNGHIAASNACNKRGGQDIDLDRIVKRGRR